MASPSRAEVETTWKNAVKLLDETRQFGNINADNWVSFEDTFQQSLESDFSPEMTAAVARTRGLIAAALSNANAAAVLLPHLRSYCRHVANTPELGDPQLMIDRIYQYMIDNSLSVNAREFTYGSPAAGGGNAGNGTLLRLTVDERNHRLEACNADAKTAMCRFDANTGTAKHEESFEFFGQAPGLDALQVSGSGRSRYIPALSARNSLLLNPSFSQLSGTITAPTAITSWTSSITVNGTNYAFDEANYYRDFQGDTTPRALQINTTGNLTQKLSVGNFKLRPDVPYMLQVAWNRAVGTASGTLLIRMGAVNNSVAVAAQTGWQILRVVASPSQNNWYRQFDEQDLDIAIEWTRTGGNLLLDDVLLVPGTNFDGTWYWLLGGSTPFLREDSFIWTDTEVGSVLQYWLWRAFGRYLPSNAAAGETWTDP